MEIYKGIKIEDLALVYKGVLIISDIHIGIEEMLNKKGVLIPRFQLKEIKERLEKIFSRNEINKIVITGDLKHEFGGINNQEWRDTLELLDYLKEKGEVVLIKGNHDKVLEPIAKKRGIKVVDYVIIDDISIMHGDRVLPNLEEVIIIGHEHAAVSFPEKKYERFKCFLKGKFKKHVLIVMPSFNTLSVGSDVMSGECLSPFLKQSLKNFEVYVVEEGVYYFGKVKDIG
jgi:uncharacterized protein